jgi:hypothetical protein
LEKDVEYRRECGQNWKSAVCCLLLIPLGVTLATSGEGEESTRCAVQEAINELDVENLVPGDLEAALGPASSTRYSHDLVECFRDGALAALCTPEALAKLPVDRSLDCGKHRGQHEYEYASYGLLFVFLEDPWQLLKVELTNEAYSLSGVHPGDPLSDVERERPVAIPWREGGGSECAEEWPDLRVHFTCAIDAGTEPMLILKVVRLNQALPSGCWLSHRGMYE